MFQNQNSMDFERSTIATAPAWPPSLVYRLDWQGREDSSLRTGSQSEMRACIDDQGRI